MAGTEGRDFKREITAAQLVWICVGAIIGAGAFSLTGIGIAYVGSAAFLVYLIVAAIAIVLIIPTMIAASACTKRAVTIFAGNYHGCLDYRTSNYFQIRFEFYNTHNIGTGFYLLDNDADY